MQSTIRLSLHVAWWAKPVAYAVAYAIRPFASVERAANAATRVFMWGVRITSEAGKPASSR
jgi:hypothetical protein